MTFLVLAPAFFSLLWFLTRFLSRTVDFEAAAGLLSLRSSTWLGLVIAAVFGPIFFLVGRAFSGGRRLRFDNHLFLFMGMAAFGAMSLEVLVNSTWNHFFHRPIWTYHVLPLHGGHTSLLGLPGSPLYGFYPYLLHQNLAANARLRKFNNLFWKSIFIGLDAMAVEVGLNLLAIVLFSSFIFYYHSPEFSHFTALEIFPIYVVIGCFVLPLLSRLEKLRRSALLGGGFFLAALALAAWGLP